MISKVSPAQNNTSFGWINISKSINLKNRLGQDQVKKLNDLVQLHDTNPIEVRIIDGINSSKKLEALLIPPEEMLCSDSKLTKKHFKETLLETLFFNPASFIERIAICADMIRIEHSKRMYLQKQLENINKA